ncbi:hypothetical protein FA15DRAFT_696368 [Coprinopsis marcescibilis]|uniref:G domain-containing protein n=1 Tax=Coprinopsis marcescibilis TaxID=230819 RepID=A0A5C3KM17_COPMA|nr:hypothetical protein FA15DRAFT_696368 [Coprinopsis marcescibilis]
MQMIQPDVTVQGSSVANGTRLQHADLLSKRRYTMALVVFKIFDRYELPCPLWQISSHEAFTAYESLSGVLAGLFADPPYHARILGSPNSGKSTFLNEIIGYNEAPTGQQTAQVGAYQYSLDNGTPIKLIDTPGLMGTLEYGTLATPKVIQAQLKQLNLSPTPAGIVIIHNILEPWTSEPPTLLRLSSLTQVVIVTTHWDEVVDHQEMEARESDILAHSKFLSHILDSGGSCARFGLGNQSNGTSSALEIVENLLRPAHPELCTLQRPVTPPFSTPVASSKELKEVLSNLSLIRRVLDGDTSKATMAQLEFMALERHDDHPDHVTPSQTLGASFSQSEMSAILELVRSGSERDILNLKATLSSVEEAVYELQDTKVEMGHVYRKVEQTKFETASIHMKAFQTHWENKTAVKECEEMEAEISDLEAMLETLCRYNDEESEDGGDSDYDTDSDSDDDSGDYTEDSD